MDCEACLTSLSMKFMNETLTYIVAEFAVLLCSLLEECFFSELAKAKLIEKLTKTFYVCLIKTVTLLFPEMLTSRCCVLFIFIYFYFLFSFFSFCDPVFLVKDLECTEPITCRNTLDCEQSKCILLARYFFIYFSKSAVSFFFFITLYLGFDSTGNGALQSAVSESPT